MMNFFEQYNDVLLLNEINSLFDNIIKNNKHLLDAFTLKLDFDIPSEIIDLSKKNRKSHIRHYLITDSNIVDLLCDFFNKNDNVILKNLNAEPYKLDLLNHYKNYIILKPKFENENQNLVSLLYNVSSDVFYEKTSSLETSVKLYQVTLKKKIKDENLEVYHFIKKNELEIFFNSINNNFYSSFPLFKFNSSAYVHSDIYSGNLFSAFSILKQKKCSINQDLAYSIFLYNLLNSKNEKIKNRVLEAMLYGKDISEEEIDNFQLINDLNIGLFKNKYNFSSYSALCSYEENFML